MNVIRAVKRLVNGVSKGQAEAISGIIIGAVMLFIGLFVISAVSDATAINNSSDFYGVQQTLVSTVGTIFSVLGLVLIVVALAIAIGALKGFMVMTQPTA